MHTVFPVVVDEGFEFLVGDRFFDTVGAGAFDVVAGGVESAATGSAITQQELKTAMLLFGPREEIGIVQQELVFGFEDQAIEAAKGPLALGEMLHHAGFEFGRGLVFVQPALAQFGEVLRGLAGQKEVCFGTAAMDGGIAAGTVFACGCFRAGGASAGAVRVVFAGHV